MLPAHVGKIPAFLNTISFFPTHAGIFYHAFYFFRYFAGIFKFLQEYSGTSHNGPSEKQPTSE